MALSFKLLPKSCGILALCIQNLIIMWSIVTLVLFSLGISIKHGFCLPSIFAHAKPYAETLFFIFF